MTEAPEKIWAGPSEDDKGVFWDIGHWDADYDAKCIEYTRSDIADTLRNERDAHRSDSWALGAIRAQLTDEVARLKVELERIEKINGLAHNYISCYDCRESSMIARAALAHEASDD